MLGRFGPQLLCFLILSAVAGSMQATEKAGTEPAEFFEREIRPLLSERCFKCHGKKKAKSGLRLTSRASILKGGDNGPAAVPGKPAASRMIQAVRQEGDLKMPPDGKLAAAQVAKLAHWIELGLPWPESRAVVKAPEAGPAEEKPFTEEQRRFWSFQPVKVAPPPTVKNRGWVRSPIDRYVLAALEARGLKHAAAADRRTLIRRATFDLTGLPPTPAEIDAFLNDASPEAFAHVVDRLLASPHYGERWGRHWLDVVRYTDSFDARILSGNGRIMDIGEAYRYRDWVVDALNRDLPYDQFIENQIAGDLLPPPSPGGVNVPGIIATGMLAIGNWGGGDADKEKLLTDIADDQVDVVCRAFLALTVACARCHDHKFDPIPTEDYYGLAGIFFSTHILKDPGPKTDGPPMLRIPLAPAGEVKRHQEMQARIAALEKEIAETPARIKAAPPGTQPVLQQQLEKRKGELAALRRTPLPPLPYANGAQEGGCPQSPQARIHDVRVHIRGRYDRLGKLVPRHFPRIVAGDRQAPIAEGSGRLQLARWIAGPSNPLTARVMVNRIWQQHFGEGLVPTPGNFGKLGQPPTNPQLLDYLADLFVRSGWSMKAMHRALMLSSAYQQSSIPDRETLTADPDNRLFGRTNRRRLEAEEIRDSLLAVTGRLEGALGGPATQDFNLPRRSLYLMTVRSDRSSFRELFDAADPTAITDKRVVSTVAPQALFLMNNSFAEERSRELARSLTSFPGDDRGRIQQAYTLLYARPPTEKELKVGLDLLSATGRNWEEYCQVLLWANEFIMID
jgi:hypothetical protein